MTVTHVLGADVIDVVTASGITIARHPLAADGTGVMVSDRGHVYALEQAAPPQETHPAGGAGSSGRGCHPSTHNDC